MTRKVKRAIEALAAEAGASSVAVAAHDLADGRTLELNAARWFHAASTIKVPILLGVFAALNFDAMGPLDETAAETNNEVENPLWHGEVHCLKRFYEMPRAERVDTKDAIFLATHEPCSLCLSAITWTGFDNFYYFFSHEDSRDAFAIPHDLKILKEVFTLDPGGYNRQNAFWTGRSLRRMIAALPEPDRARLSARADALAATYDDLSAAFARPTLST